MIYYRTKLEDLIFRLQAIREYDYICYPSEDEEKVVDILNNIEKQVDMWEKLQDENYGY